MNNGWEVGYLEVIIPPSKAVSQDEEERMCKPRGCGEWVG